MERDREGELVATRVDRAAGELLGRHVRRRARPRAGAGERRAEQGLRGGGGIGGIGGIGLARRQLGQIGAGEPEVGHLDHAVIADQDVVRLEVAVDEAGAVRSGQPAAGGAKHLQHFIRAARCGLEPAGQVAALDVLHGDEHPVLEGPDVEDRRHVGVRDLRHGLRLAQESRVRGRGLAGGEQLGAQELETDLAPELAVVGQTDGAHAAGADVPDDDVAVEHRPRRQLLGLGRGGRGDGEAGALSDGPRLQSISPVRVLVGHRRDHRG